MKGGDVHDTAAGAKREAAAAGRLPGVYAPLLYCDQGGASPRGEGGLWGILTPVVVNPVTLFLFHH